MLMTRKEEIIMKTMQLAGQYGLSNVTMNMIGEAVGIKKPSLYKHFKSKEDIVENMYACLREKAKTNSIPIDYSLLFKDRTPYEILHLVVDNYKKMNEDENMLNFYKIIYTERCNEPMASKILVEETEKMIMMTKQLFYALEVHHIMHFEHIDAQAVSFAFTIHGLLDYALDKNTAGEALKENTLLEDYLHSFCLLNEVKP